MAEIVNVGLIGYGTVGKGTAEVLLKNKNLIFENTGIDIRLKTVADLAIDTANPDELLSLCEVVTNNAEDILNDQDIDIVVELIGGYTFAKDFIISALNKKKHVVSANKALFAMYGTEIYQAAELNNVSVCFEGAVGGGIPVLRVIKEDLAGNNINEIFGIINGTANYILSKMEKEGKEFEEVLKVAQELGYAEADPTFDIEGIDSAHKIAILASMAFNTLIPFEKIYVEGITSIKQIDIEFAKKLDCKIKLLAIAKKHENDLEVRVHPTMVPDVELMAQVDGVFNAVEIIGDMSDKTMHYGRGAGGKPTGSAVAGDVISIARDIAAGCTKRTPILGFKKDYTYYYPIKDIKDIKSAFYLRFSVVDEPGTLAMIAGVLAKYNISISEAIQTDERAPGEAVNMVFMTHKALARKIYDAIEEIDKSDVMRDKTVAIRVKELV
ncbi:Homoserine dehydrogenase [Denitrovibrio acetiphilus DSM 12809]|uniref:Homoserine dehydrogenase n=1 Tax=Denitrovibrio acetiphilus (strain DSM 12809 / NBRC 114555 / N2460) TaxID=522772 RepID=D4H840_DENA2|nr:homoserine dehydrogenase [Denitrovibrio acetiphilus]ADD68189.1 Homoserine dehydrogenase [Denitrovibrio acetiphilus DSM 12809]